MKTHWRKHDETDFLGAVDIDNLGLTELKLHLINVEWKKAKVRGKEDFFRIANFKDGVKPMILNVTNGKAIKKVICSKYLDDWRNLEIVVYIKEGVRMGSDVTEALRIKSVKKIVPKVKEKLSDERFKKALSSFKIDEVTKEQLMKAYDLSDNQIKELC